MNSEQLSEAMKLMGAKGGKARAQKLTAEELSKIGRKGGRPRKKKAHALRKNRRSGGT